MSQTPYAPLTADQKKVTFHGPPVNHSGILPSGEGNYIDNNQSLTNDKNYVASSDAPFKGSPSNNPREPLGNEPSMLAPSGVTAAFSNSNKFPPATFSQGVYIHYVPSPNAGQGLIDKTPAAITYDPTSTYTTNTNPYYPYGQ